MTTTDGYCLTSDCPSNSEPAFPAGECTCPDPATEFSGDTLPEALASWGRYSALPVNPGTENYTPEMREQDAYTAGFAAALSSRAGDPDA